MTALNPVLGYNEGAKLAKEATAQNTTLRAVALEKIQKGELKHKDDGHTLTIQEIDAVLGDLRALTETGVHGVGGGG